MTTAKTRNPNRPNRTQRPNQPVVAVPDTEHCCDGMITLQVDQIDNYQRNAYGTTNWATDYAGRNPVEGVNGMIKSDGSFNPESCRVFGTAPHTSPGSRGLSERPPLTGLSRRPTDRGPVMDALIRLRSAVRNTAKP